MRIIIFCSLLICSLLQGQKGIVIACSDRYVEYLIPSLAYLRWELHCKLPIQIWYAGDELSDDNKKIIELFYPIECLDIVDFLGPPANQYWGFQIKPLIIQTSSFQEVILADADVYFYKDPSTLFKNKHYIETGAYFFKDQDILRFPREDYSHFPKKFTKESTLLIFNDRKRFFRTLIDKPSKYLPYEWRYFWEDEDPTLKNSATEHFMESGCVAIDKNRHAKGLQNIVQLNLDREITYQYMWGDKETFWIGLEMAKEPYYVNQTIPYSLHGRFKYNILPKKVKFVHFVEGEMFFQQKHPIQLGNYPYFARHINRPLTEKEKEQIQIAHFYKETFTARNLTPKR